MNCYADPLVLILAFAALAVAGLIAAATIYIKQSETTDNQRKLVAEMGVVTKNTSELTNAVSALAEVVATCTIRRRSEVDSNA